MEHRLHKEAYIYDGSDNLTTIKAGMMLTMGAYLTKANCKSLQVYFHTVSKEIETNSCLEVVEIVVNCMHRKMANGIEKYELWQLD